MQEPMFLQNIRGISVLDAHKYEFLVAVGWRVTLGCLEKPDDII